MGAQLVVSLILDLQIADCGLRIADLLPECGMADCGFIAGVRVRIYLRMGMVGNPQSAVKNESAIRNPQ
jgi:hypothetical protein